MLFNVTDLGSYLYCARKVFLKKVLKLKEPLNRAMFKGNVRHNFFDDVIKNEKNVVMKIQKNHDLNDIRETYKKYYSEFLKKIITINLGSLKQFKIRPSDVFEKNWFAILNEIETRSRIAFETKQQTGLFGFELWKAMFPKIKTEIKIQSEILKLTGIIDRIEYFKDCVVPYEIKTGSSPQEGVWPNHKIQIGSYLLLLRDSGENISNGFVRYSDIDEDRKVVLNHFLELEIKEIINKLQEMIDKKEIPQHCKNKNKCNKCALKKQCYDSNFIGKLINEIKLNN